MRMWYSTTAIDTKIWIHLRSPCRKGEWGAKPRESVTVKPEWDKSGYLVSPLSPPEPEAEPRIFRASQLARASALLPAVFSDGRFFARIQFLRD